MVLSSVDPKRKGWVHTGEGLGGNRGSGGGRVTAGTARKTAKGLRQ